MADMRRVLLLSLVCALGVSCTTSDAPSGISSPTPSSSDRAAALVGDDVSLPWTLESADGSTLHLKVTSGGCIVFDHVAADETSTDVLVAAVGVDTSKPGQVCTQELLLGKVSYTLQQPLGERPLTHVATDARYGTDRPSPEGS
jgi:hypothetical protein